MVENVFMNSLVNQRTPEQVREAWRNEPRKKYKPVSMTPDQLAQRRRQNEERRQRAYIKKRKAWAAKNPSRSHRRRKRTQQATPSWLTVEQAGQIAALYEEAKARPGNWHVDHIIPLRGKNVSGLHVPWNLQVIPAKDNLKKGNRVEAV